MEAENKLLREQLKAAEAARKTAQDALTGERALWERREKGWEKQRGELQQQVTATGQVRAVGGGGEGSADPDHVLYLQAAAVELHSALSAQRHVAINMGVKEATLTELLRTCLTPSAGGRKRARGVRIRAASGRRNEEALAGHGFGARQVVTWRAKS